MKSRKQLLPDEKILRRVLFAVCKTKAGLHRWVKTYLGIDLPDCCVDPESNSNPMDFLWQMYQAALTNDDSFQMTMVYAARDSFKTLVASIMEVLAICHLGRSVAHMAAIESQAKKAQEYIKKFMSRPFLREFVTLKNERKVEITWYKRTGGSVTDALTLSEFEMLTVEEKNLYEEFKEYISIVICTVAGANSEHTTFMTVDEVDVIVNKEAYEEAKFIPAPRDGKLAMTMMVSSRKYSWGLVQKEIDNAAETGLKVLHWNIIDVTQACSKEIHMPEAGMETIYYSRETVDAISEEKYLSLPEEEKTSFVRDTGYYGCLHKCNLFAMCRGRLATSQHSASSMLKPVKHVQGLKKKANRGRVKAQMACWEPTEEGRIYGQFNRETHMLTAAQMAFRLTGEEHDPDLTKGALINTVQSMGLPFYAGMDFGMSHNFAVVVGFVAANRLYIIDCISGPGLGPSERLLVCDGPVKPLGAVIYADPAEPASIKFFKQAGYQMRAWTKKQHSVNDGIEIVRYKLNPSGDEPEMYLLANDEHCALLAKRIEDYHWLLGADGKPMGVPDDEDDDECDATRYLVMNVFAPRTRAGMPGIENPRESNYLIDSQYTQENWMQKVIAENMGPDSAGEDSLRIKKNGFIVEM